MRPAPLRPATAPTTTATQPARYLTNDEAAEFLRLSPRTLEKQRVIGGGPRFGAAQHGSRTSPTTCVPWWHASLYPATR